MAAVVEVRDAATNRVIFSTKDGNLVVDLKQGSLDAVRGALSEASQIADRMFSEGGSTPGSGITPTLQAIVQLIEELKGQMSGTASAVGTLQEEVAELKTKSDQILSDVDGVQSSMAQMKADLDAALAKVPDPALAAEISGISDRLADAHDRLGSVGTGTPATPPAEPPPVEPPVSPVA